MQRNENMHRQNSHEQLKSSGLCGSKYFTILIIYCITRRLLSVRPDRRFNSKHFSRHGSKFCRWANGNKRADHVVSSSYQSGTRKSFVSSCDEATFRWAKWSRGMLGINSITKVNCLYLSRKGTSFNDVLLCYPPQSWGVSVAKSKLFSKALINKSPKKSPNKLFSILSCHKTAVVF